MLVARPNDMNCLCNREWLILYDIGITYLLELMEKKLEKLSKKKKKKTIFNHWMSNIDIEKKKQKKQPNSFCFLLFKMLTVVWFLFWACHLLPWRWFSFQINVFTRNDFVSRADWMWLRFLGSYNCDKILQPKTHDSYKYVIFHYNHSS